MLSTIKQNIHKCGPLQSAKLYTFKDNIPYLSLVDELKKINYNIVKQIVNYNTQTIGAIVQKNESTGWGTCFGSKVCSAYAKKLI